MYTKPGLQTEPWNLPVGQIKDLILTCFKNLNQSFTEELNTETAYGSLSNGIKYVDDRILADGPAEIGYDGEKGVITVYEPFLAFLWCFCYLFITTRASQHLKYEISDEKRLQAIALFEYGLSLFKKWSEWDLTLPNPATYEEKECAHIEEVNTLFCSSAAFILCHEFGHHFYGHTHPKATILIEDEFLADSYSLEVFMEKMEAQGEVEKEAKRLGALVGLSSILFVGNSWYGNAEYPDSDERLKKVMNELAPKPDDSLWAYGVLILSLWRVTYQDSIIHFSTDISKAKAEFHRLAFEIKALQAEQLFR